MAHGLYVSLDWQLADCGKFVEVFDSEIAVRIRLVITCQLPEAWDVTLLTLYRRKLLDVIQRATLLLH